jgi:VWFA-related protein
MSLAIISAASRTRNLSVSLALCLLCVFNNTVYGSSQQQVPSYHVASRLVELTVVATDKDGKPLTSLEAKDFRIFDNGKLRLLSLCRYEGGIGKSSAASQQLPPFIYSNRAIHPSADDRNVTALVLDTANTDPNRQMIVKAQTARFLRALAPHTRVAIYQLGNRFTVLHDFTDDMESLRADMEKLNLQFPAQDVSNIEQAELALQELLEQMAARSQPNMAAMKAAIDAATADFAGQVNSNAVIQGNRVLSTLAILESIGQHLTPVPGRKSVVWISGGISLFSQQVSTNPRAQLNPMVGNNWEAAIRKTSERLAQSGVVLYGVDAHGLAVPDDNFARRQYPPMVDGRFSELERSAAMKLEGRAAFSLITSVTGGRYIFGTNDLAKGVDQVTSDLDGSYTLGFYTPDEPDGKWHRLKVEIKQPGAHLLHKEGYLADPVAAKSTAWDEERVRSILTSPFGSAAIRLTARCAPSSGSESGALQLTLQIEADDIQWRNESDRMTAAIEVYIVEKSAGEAMRFHHSKINARFLPAQMVAVREKGLPFNYQWKIGTGTHKLRVLIRDIATGQFGTLDIPISQASEIK